MPATKEAANHTDKNPNFWIWGIEIARSIAKKHLYGTLTLPRVYIGVSTPPPLSCQAHPLNRHTVQAPPF